MKIKVIKEKDYYYSEIKWVEWVYAQWTTLNECLSNLASVYENVLKTKFEWLIEKKHIKESSLNKFEFVV